MRAPTLLTAFALAAISTKAFALSLTIAGDRIDFTSPEAVQGKATWSTPSKLPLDFTPAGLGCDAVIADNAMIDACIETKPIAVGTYGQPWLDADISVDVTGFIDEAGYSCVGRVFVRHSPDLKHWTTWQALMRKQPEQLAAELKRWQKKPHPLWREVAHNAAEEEYIRKTIFVGTLDVPRSVRARFENRLEEFAATKPPRPKFQEDALRWILVKDPGYLAESTPSFIGYIQFQIEAYLGRERRIKSLSISCVSDADPLIGHLQDGNDYSGYDRWQFVAP